MKRHHWWVGLLVTMSAFAGAQSDWPQFQHDARRSGYNPDGPLPPYKAAWRVRLDDYFTEQTQPVVTDGRLLIGSVRGVFYCLDGENGSVVWTNRIGSPMVHAAGAADGRVFVGARNGIVYCMAVADGEKLWETATGRSFYSAPALDSGKVLIGNTAGAFYALAQSDGSVLWKTEVGQPILQTAASDGTRVYFGDEAMRFHALDLADGSTVWSRQLWGESFYASHPVAAAGKVMTMVVSPYPSYPETGYHIFGKLEHIFLKHRYVPGTPGAAEKLRKAQDEAAALYAQHPKLQTFYVMNADTGEQPYVTAVTVCGSNTGVQCAPVMCDDDLYLLYSPEASYVRMAPITPARFDLASGRVVDTYVIGQNQPGRTAFYTFDPETGDKMDLLHRWVGDESRYLTSLTSSAQAAANGGTTRCRQAATYIASPGIPGGRMFTRSCAIPGPRGAGGRTMNKSLYRFISGAMLAAALTAAEDAPWQERSDGFVAKPPLLDREYDHDKKFTPHWGGLSWLVQEGAPRLRKPTARMAAQEHHYRYGNLANMRTPFPGYLDFGVIAPPAAANGALRATGGDWCRRELALEADGKTAMTLIVSRLSPALLAESDSAEFMIFGRTIGSAQPFHCVSPRWMAYPSGGGTAVSELKEQPVVFDQPADWLLLWQGKTNAFGNATMNRDISYKYSEWLGWGGIHSPEWERHICYEADAPVLLVFGNPAVCAQKEADGGVVCGFERAAGALAVMPLFDFAYPRAEETDRWRQALPETVSRACRAWASRLLQFPLAVRESWKVDERADAVHIDDAFAFRPLRGAEEGVRFAPLPPMLAVAMGAGFPISLSGKPSDTGLMTYCGPYQGVEGASQYTLRIAGTKKYYRETRVIKPPSGGEMERRLGAELRGLVAPVIDEGPFAPWSPYLGIIAAWPADILWMNPESQISYPLSFLPVLEKDQQSRLAAYLRRVREELPPESVPAIPWKAGTRRERCRDSYEPDGILEYRLKNAHLEDGPARRGMIPFERAYTLENYYRLVGTPAERTAAWPAVRELLSPYLGYEDWATSWLFFHPKDGVPSEILFSPTYLDSFRGAGEVNGAIAGLIGLARWADLENDEEHGNLAKYLLAKRLALRFAMEKLTGAMVAAGLVNTAPYLGKMYDHLWYYQGRGPEDDPRVVASLDETTVVLSVFSAPHCARPGWVVSFDRMTPELARFLKDWLLPESARTVDYLEKVTPHWDAAYHRSSIGTTGDHNDLERPETGYSILPREELDSRRNPIRTGKPARLSSAAGRGLVLHGQTGGNYQGLPRLGLEGAGVEMRFQHVEEKRAAA